MIQWPNIGLWGEFAPCEADVLARINTNFKLLDTLVQLRVIDFITELPEDPGPGDRYILEDDTYIYSETGSVIVVWNYEDEEWEYIPAQAGYLAFVLNETGLYWYNGDQWVELPINPVQGPSSAMDREVAVFDGLTGKWITGSGAFIDTDQKFHAVKSIYVDDLILNDNAIYSETIIRTISELHTEDKLAVKRELEFYQTNDISTGDDVEISNPETVITRFTESGLNSVAGITPGKSKFVILTNVKGARLTIKHLTGTVGSQIDTGIDGDLDIENNSSIMLYEDVEDEVWRVIGGTGGGGGSAVGSLEFYTVDAIPSPNDGFLGLLKVVEFEPNEEHYLFFKFVVPLGYKPGDVLSFKDGKAYVNSTDTSKDFQFTVAVYLMDTDTPVPTGIGDLASEGLADATLVGAVANAARPLDPLPISDSSGEIDGVPVEPGMVIFGAIYRSPSNEADSVQATVKLDLASLRLSLKD